MIVLGRSMFETGPAEPTLSAMEANAGEWPFGGARKPIRSEGFPLCLRDVFVCSQAASVQKRPHVSASVRQWKELLACW